MISSWQLTLALSLLWHFSTLAPLLIRLIIKFFLVRDTNNTYTWRCAELAKKIYRGKVPIYHISYIDISVGSTFPRSTPGLWTRPFAVFTVYIWYTSNNQLSLSFPPLLRWREINKLARIFIASYGITNPQRRFTITVLADVTTIITNCFHTRWYAIVLIVDDEMLLVMSHRKLRLEMTNWLKFDRLKCWVNVWCVLGACTDQWVLGFGCVFCACWVRVQCVLGACTDQ